MFTTKEMSHYQQMTRLLVQVVQSLKSLQVHCFLRSKLSSVCWNSYVKSNLICSDYEGVVQLWDVGQQTETMTFEEHAKRVWSVDFSQVHRLAVHNFGMPDLLQHYRVTCYSQHYVYYLDSSLFCMLECLLCICVS